LGQQALTLTLSQRERGLLLQPDIDKRHCQTKSIPRPGRIHFRPGRFFLGEPPGGRARTAKNRAASVRRCKLTQPCATVTDVQTLDGYRLELTFADGVRGIVDLANRIVGRGGVFGPLGDPKVFRQITVDSEL